MAGPCSSSTAPMTPGQSPSRTSLLMQDDLPEAAAIAAARLISRTSESLLPLITEDIDSRRLYFPLTVDGLDDWDTIQMQMQPARGLETSKMYTQTQDSSESQIDEEDSDLELAEQEDEPGEMQGQENPPAALTLRIPERGGAALHTLPSSPPPPQTDSPWPQRHQQLHQQQRPQQLQQHQQHLQQQPQQQNWHQLQQLQRQQPQQQQHQKLKHKQLQDQQQQQQPLDAFQHQLWQQKQLQQEDPAHNIRSQDVSDKQVMQVPARIVDSRFGVEPRMLTQHQDQTEIGVQRQMPHQRQHWQQHQQDYCHQDYGAQPRQVNFGQLPFDTQWRQQQANDLTASQQMSLLESPPEFTYMDSRGCNNSIPNGSAQTQRWALDTGCAGSGLMPQPDNVLLTPTLTEREMLETLRSRQSTMVAYGFPPNQAVVLGLRLFGMGI